MKPCFDRYHSLERHGGCTPPAPNGFLMQRILACGKLHRRPECVFLCPDALPCGAAGPFQVEDALIASLPQWDELPACCRGSVALQARTPVCLTLRDGCGRTFSIHTTLRNDLTLRTICPQTDLWRGQILVQAAVRPWRGCMPCQDGHTVCVELLEGYVLAPCAVSAPSPCCPDPRPLYPQPLFDPYQD